ncbi:Receptor-like kinase in in flowers 3 [Hibiscus syriacus]|uniref:Receptor-like kinase in in flowers 3 n=1 Tax=Hibiscus syriacus TaxID=106335 RepID=A0A6A2Y660_HIBSY|nr:Receptor-like kinase in in flowers 3 [Hibiscus syriacus]
MTINDDLSMTIVAFCGSFEFGSCAVFSSATPAEIMYSEFGSILIFGAGAITSGPAMRTATGFCVAGWLAIYFAKGALSLDIGRLATGYGLGIFSYVVPVFIAEIVPKNLRGALTAVNQLMICTGVSVSFIIGTVITWRTLTLTGLVPCAILLVGLFYIPETPRWLIGVGLMFFQQFGGISGIFFYVSNIFESADNGTSEPFELHPDCIWPQISPIIKVAIFVLKMSQESLPLPITAFFTTVIDKAGRKPVILISSTGLILSCILSGMAFYLKDHNLAPNSVPILSAAGILIFPINIKGVAGSLATLVNWFCGGAVTYSFNYLMSWISSGK